jgi:hypothetical protein
MIWNPGVNTEGEVTAKRLDILINKREKCILIDVANTCRQKGHAKEAENENKYEFVYRARMNVVHEM